MALMIVAPAVRLSVYTGNGVATASYTAFSAVRSSEMCAAIIRLDPALSSGSAKPNTPSPACDRNVLMAARSSEI
jgi:hypothetical protein